MRQMKDSGIEWIGEIPESWSVHPAKYAFTEIRDKNTDGKIQVALQFKNGTIIRKNNFEVDSDDYVADTILNYTIVEPDVIMINGLNLNYDLKSLRVAIVREKGVITSAYLALMPDKTKLYPDFANYLFKGYETKMAFHNMGAGIRLTLGFREFKKQPVLFPETYEEQHLISAHLDRQCSLIDSVIEKTKASIEEYKKLRQAVITQAVTKGVRGDRAMKDSGIEWIGEIPEEWNLIPFRHILKERQEKNSPVKTEERLSLSIDLGVTLYAEKTTNLDRFKEDFEQYKLAHKGDLVMNSMNMIVGATGVSNYYGCVSPVYYTFYDELPDHATAKYCEYIFRSKTMLRVLYSLGKGIYAIVRGDDRVNTCRLKVAKEDLKSLSIPQPPVEEQREIIAYLTRKAAEIDVLIAKKEQFLTELDSYKKSLIYEYVTGKKEVPQV